MMAAPQDLRIPAHRFRQGGRDVYACALDLPALNARLPDRVDDRVVRDANRQLTPSHARRIQGLPVGTGGLAAERTDAGRPTGSGGVPSLCSG